MKRSNGEEVGRQTLTVDIQDDGRTVLGQSFKGETSDATSVVVDSRTLKPVSSTRRVITEEDDITIDSTYTPEGVSIKQGDKLTGLTVPDFAYDNDTSLFLWRSLPYDVGWEGTYITIITNRRSRQRVHLAAVRREIVTIPAGQFSAWRLEIKTSNARQIAWYADTPRRELLRYDNDRGLIFELDTAPNTASR